MALSLATVGAKITATFMNLIIGQVNKQGLTAVIPTSVSGTGVTVGADGKVSFSASSTVTINGCFTGTYENYLLVFTGTSSASAFIRIQLALSGTAAATNYDVQELYGSSTTAGASRSTAATQFQISSGGNTCHFVETKVLGPALAAATQFFAAGNSYDPSGFTSFTYTNGGAHRTATAYDGVVFTPNTGTLTGSVRIFGINDN